MLSLHGKELNNLGWALECIIHTWYLAHIKWIGKLQAEMLI